MKIHLIENSKVTNPVTGLELNLGDKAIIQGSSYTLTLLYEGDYSLWKPEGEIKNNYHGRGGTPLGSFTFGPLIYDSTTDQTSIVCNLKASVTKNIPPTLYQSQEDMALDTKTAYVYEIRLRLEQINRADDQVISIVEPSFVQVKPGVF